MWGCGSSPPAHKAARRIQTPFRSPPRSVRFSSRSHDLLCERLGAADPSQGPLGLLRDAGDGVDRVEEAMLLVRVFDVHLEKEAVHLGVDVLNGDLEPVEGTSLGDLDLLHKPPNTILKDDAVGGSEEGENV
ncbi:hypothetical protein ACFX11_003567 [Malus domestica]